MPRNYPSYTQLIQYLLGGIYYVLLLYATVTGEANFVMECTGLTVGGFTQPAVARTLIEQPNSAEKGLCQRFLWIFPKPVFARFATLEPVDQKFTDAVGKEDNIIC